jgi:metal-responsive CopG/Arc/MetJ family transcriptional regulator
MNISIPDDLVEAVQQIKEDIGVSRFFRKKVKEYIKAKNNETSGKGGTT